MNSSTSSSEPHHVLPIPDELSVTAQRPRQQRSERRFARWVALASPVLAAAAWYAANRWLLFVLYLQPIPASMDWAASWRWLPSLAVGAAAGALPWFWLGQLRPDRSGPGRPGLVASSCVVALVALALVSAPFYWPRAAWFFTEWSKVRTPNPSFARNTLFWEARTFDRWSPRATGEGQVGLVGSSQINQATDGALLAELLGVAVEKNAAAGLGPLQFLYLQPRIVERRHALHVFWLSEFDFYREDDVPVERLRWASSVGGVVSLARVVAAGRPLVETGRLLRAMREGAGWPDDRDDLWRSRGALVDLAFAAVSPLWRHRDHVRRSLFGYWWDRSRPADPVDGARQGVLAAFTDDMDAARENLGSNVGRKRLVEANFLAFETVAQGLLRVGSDIVVVEGVSHPAAMTAYPAQLRVETRRRLQAMATRLGFRYLSEARLPHFGEADFADAYHLNALGRERFTRFLAAYLKTGRARRLGAPGDDLL